MKSSMMFVRLIVAVLCLAMLPALTMADDGYPNTIPHPPVMPGPGDDVPETPVPPVPTDSELYEAYVYQLSVLYAQLQTAQSNVMLYQAILALDPDREDVLAVVRQFQAQVAMIQLHIQWIQLQISYLNP